MAVTDRDEAGAKPRPGTGEAQKQRHEAVQVRERSQPRAPVIYEIIRRSGEEEMDRPAISLWWSGISAGLSISFSVVAQGLLRLHLPDEPWRVLVAGLGYSIGFLIVILSRQQLFTENTITVVLPVVADPTARNLARLGRIWGIVFAANLVGTLVSAALSTHTPIIPPDLLEAMRAIGRDMLDKPTITMFWRAIPAGFLIAATVWLLPSADAGRVPVILILTSLIAIGEFPHIIAGSVEALLLVLDGSVAVTTFLGHFLLPVLAGNVVGGTVLFGLLSYGQVMREIE